MDAEPDDGQSPAGGLPEGDEAPQGDGRSDGGGSSGGGGPSEGCRRRDGGGPSGGGGQADGPRPGLVGVLWCVVVIVAVLVIGVAMVMLDGR
ncbi:hypothetical protein H1Q78_13390 [Cellulosimicrobium cellulans]|uniref:hypothetical protein n=1 Tax=Cellulosimicrobium cellulans TaxID=1710 RepID=UPI001EDB4975|nr:hypothetical protein [Cellulosimicrobium cellulans]UKJ62735.1 hypothetical protein H1Q78_13390 [Cellulosimicrobium cellulans]